MDGVSLGDVVEGACPARSREGRAGKLTSWAGDFMHSLRIPALRYQSAVPRPAPRMLAMPFPRWGGGCLLNANPARAERSGRAAVAATGVELGGFSAGGRSNDNMRVPFAATLPATR